MKKIGLIIFFLVSVLFSFMFMNRVNATNSTIYIGDSRTQGMSIYGITNSSNTVYGAGYGYNWFIGNGSFSSSYTNSTSGGIAGANAKMQGGKKYNIVIWLGVNDYSYIGANKYYQKFASLANNEWKNHNIYIVSVGPVDDDKASYVDNNGINSFNNSMSTLISNGNISNLKYIDLGYTESSISSYDSEGLHYGKSDYQKIFNDINSGISRIENNNSNNNNNDGNNSDDVIIDDSIPEDSEFDSAPLTCDDFFSPELRDIVSGGYTILKVAAILLTLILGMIDFAKGIYSNDSDYLKKASKKFVKRLIACIVILLLPLIINPIVEMAIGVENGTCNIV